MTFLVTTAKTTAKVLDLLDADLKDNIIEAIGLRSSQKDFEAAIPEHGAVAGIAEQVRVVGEIARLAQDKADRNTEVFHKALWRLQNYITDTIQDELKKQYVGKEEQPPDRVHIRRAVEETVEAASRATTHDEENLLLEVFLASLTAEGTREAIGAKLRKLVTSGVIGPLEVRELRRLEADSAGSAGSKLQANHKDKLDVIFEMARVRPALVQVMGVGPARHNQYMTRIDQLNPGAACTVNVTNAGKTMLRLLIEVRARLDEISSDSQPKT